MSRELLTLSVVLVAAAALAAQAQVISSVSTISPAPVQISPGPLVDGAKAYVDRTHVFRNTPPALVGAQYVQLANDDKNSPLFELHLTIGKAGALYLILDNRVGTNLRDPAISANPTAAGMTWMTGMGFVDTGMKMAIDENADGSINNYFSVFSLQVAPGVVVLKAQYDRSLGGPQDRNMYAVAAAEVRKATNPIPADGKSTTASPLLQWTPGVDAVLHNVYVGTSPQLGQTDLVGPQVSVPYFQHPGSLIPEATYYWRVDEIEADGVTVNTGDVWTFTVQSVVPVDPSPVDGAPWVDLDTTLRWKAGLNAVLHNVYLGTDRATVASGAEGTFQGTIYFAAWQPPRLEPDTTYFWRVEEVAADGSITTGPVWSFRTIRPIAMSDPNLLGWWKMDEGIGDTVVDWSGYGHHAQFAKPAPTWAAGLLGGALLFPGNGESAVYEDGSFLNGLDALTIAAWIRSDVTETDKGFLIFEPPIGEDDRDMRYDAAGITAGGWNVLKMGVTISQDGVDTTVQLESSNDSQTTEWQHVALVWASGQALKLYLDGELDSPTFSHPPATGRLVGYSTMTIGKGSKDVVNSSWDGLVDELRIFGKALTRQEIQVVMRGDSSLAWGPMPANGATAHIFEALPITWQAGDKAIAHDVYLGESQAAVSEATTTDTTGIYRGRLTDTSYMPEPPLELIVRYFWRVDEVNADGSISRGFVWNFMLDD